MDPVIDQAAATEATRRLRLIDERGRLFGRVNVIDAIVLAIVVLLIPLGYAAVWLLRPPVPQILSVEPARLRAGPDLRVRLTGKDLRPFLRASVGDKNAVFLVASPTVAELKLPELPPGSYDIVLFDAAQEVSRRPGAVVIEAASAAVLPTISLDVLGIFTGLDRDTAAALKAAEPLGNGGGEGSGEILYVRDAEPDVARVREQLFLGRAQDARLKSVALVRLRCGLTDSDCRIGGTAVAAGAVLNLGWRKGALQFRVSGLLPGSTEALPEINVVGAFVDLEPKDVDVLGEMLPSRATGASWGRIISLGRSEPDTIRLRSRTADRVSSAATGKLRVSAVLALRCSMVGAECRVGSTAVAPDVRLSIPSRHGLLAFEVMDLFPAAAGGGAVADVRLSGSFVGLDGLQARRIAQRLSSLSWAEFWGKPLFIGPVESNTDGTHRVSALLALRCVGTPDDCRFAGIPLTPHARLSIPTPEGLLPFEVADRFPSDVRALGEIKISGAFVRLDATRAASVARSGVSDPLMPELWGGVLSLGSAEPDVVRVRGKTEPVAATGNHRVAAVITLRCAVAGVECRIGTTAVATDAIISIPTRQGILSFEVSDLYPTDVDVAEVRVSGTFVGLDASRAQSLTAASGSEQKPEFWGHTISAGRAEPELVQFGSSALPSVGATGKFNVPAQLMIRCVMVANNCKLGSVNVLPEARLTIPARQGLMSFDVRAVFAYSPTIVRITMRSATDRTILALMQQELAGDRRPVLSNLEARLLSVEESNEQVTLRTGQGAYSWDQPGVAFSAVFDVPAQKGPRGWQFDGQPLKAGERFTYTRPEYTIGGVMTAVSIPDQATSPR